MVKGKQPTYWEGEMKVLKYTEDRTQKVVRTMEHARGVYLDGAVWRLQLWPLSHGEVLKRNKVLEIF